LPRFFFRKRPRFSSRLSFSAVELLLAKEGSWMKSIQDYLFSYVQQTVVVLLGGFVKNVAGWTSGGAVIIPCMSLLKRQKMVGRFQGFVLYLFCDRSLFFLAIILYAQTS